MDPTEGNLLVTQVCEDVRSLYQKTEKLKAIWRTAVEINMELNNKIANLQREILVLQEQVRNLEEDERKSRHRETKLQNEVRELKEQVTELEEELNQSTKKNADLKNEVRELRERLRVLPKELAGLKLQQFLLQIPNLMFRRVFPVAGTKTYTLKNLNDSLKTNAEKQAYNELLTKLGLKEQFILGTIEDVIVNYRLNRIQIHADKNIKEDIEAEITNMTEFEQLFEQSEIESNDVNKCRLLAEAYLHLQTNKA